MVRVGFGPLLFHETGSVNACRIPRIQKMASKEKIEEKAWELLQRVTEGTKIRPVDAEYAKEGKISCIGECNPLHGKRVENIIRSLEKNEAPDKYEYVDEDIFSGETSVKNIEVDGKGYAVKILGK